jgi:hypothetical protein
MAHLPAFMVVIIVLSWVIYRIPYSWCKILDREAFLSSDRSENSFGHTKQRFFLLFVSQKYLNVSL